MSVFAPLKHHIRTVLIIVFTMLLVMNAAVAYYLIWGRGHWDPLPNYNEQIVDLPRTDVTLSDGKVLKNIPTLYYSKNSPTEVRLPVVGVVKCSTATEPIKVDGVVSYAIDLPEPPSLITVSYGSSIRNPGCVGPKNYSNLVPYVILNAVETILPTSPVIMRYTGVETPIGSDGSPGVSKIWSTEQFAIVQK